MEKSPCIHVVMFWIKSSLYAKKVPIELIILPNINTTRGMNTGYLNCTLSSIFINKYVQIKENAKEPKIFLIELASVNNINEISAPNFAESNVPAVVGDTNLFLLNCCIINPAILILAPAITILIKRGSLLINKTSVSSSVKSTKSRG